VIISNFADKSGFLRSQAVLREINGCAMIVKIFLPHSRQPIGSDMTFHPVTIHSRPGPDAVYGGLFQISNSCDLM
jgi:hypothetical protein